MLCLNQNLSRKLVALDNTLPSKMYFALAFSLLLLSWKRSGQTIIFHQARFPWNKGICLTQLPFGVGSCEVALIWPEKMKKFPNNLTVPPKPHGDDKEGEQSWTCKSHGLEDYDKHSLRHTMTYQARTWSSRPTLRCCGGRWVKGQLHTVNVHAWMVKPSTGPMVMPCINHILNILYIKLSYIHDNYIVVYIINKNLCKLLYSILSYKARPNSRRFC